MGGKRAREQCVLAGRLEEIGCVAVGGRGQESQQCQGKPDELPAAKLGERSIRSMRRSLVVGIAKYKQPDVPIPRELKISTKLQKIFYRSSRTKKRNTAMTLME